MFAGNGPNRVLRAALRLVSAAAALTVIAGSAMAAPAINASGPGKLAIGGADAVAYFADGKPAAGVKDFEFEWMDATWRFASAAHRDAFAADPEKYAPRYGGYCAYAVAKGAVADIDPEAWTIVDGKLYLNFSKSVRTRWREDIPGNIAAADANWPKLKSRPAP